MSANHLRPECEWTNLKEKKSLTSCVKLSCASRNERELSSPPAGQITHPYNGNRWHYVSYLKTHISQQDTTPPCTTLGTELTPQQCVPNVILTARRD